MTEIKARHAVRSASRPALFAACAVAAAGLAITGGGVFAALNATASNTTAQNAGSGTLSLTMAPGTGTGSSAGFSQSVSNLAPGDTVNRYVTLNQGSSMDGKDLTLAVADATPSKLTTDPANGLHVTVTQCSVAWTPGTACSGTATTLQINGTPLSQLGTAAAVKSGAITSGSVLYLQVSLTLPDQTETTVNGTPTLPTSAPAGTTTIQGLSSALTWTFGETQRTATITGS